MSSMASQRVIASALMLASTACGLGAFDSEPGGDSNLPTQAAGPYGKPDVDFDTPADEPFLIEFNRAHATDPAALWRADGGLRIWFTYESVEPDSSAEIWAAEVPSITDVPDVAPAIVVAATEAWEQGRVAAPAVLHLGDGEMLMFYEGGDTDRAVGRADSTDGGQTWQKFAGNPLLLDAAQPTVGVIDGRFYLYFERPSAPGIYLATSEDGAAFLARDLPVITARPNEGEAFDRDGVAQPFVLATERDGASPHFGLFFVGQRFTGEELDAAIGYAGAFDGETFTRFADGEAVLSPGLPAETGPSVVSTSARGIMLYAQERRGTERIAVAVHE